MRLNAVNILGIRVTNASKKTILEELQKYLDFGAKTSQKSLKIYTPNTEQLVLAQKNKKFREVLNRADVALPDSGGVVWAMKVLGQKFKVQRIPGVEFMEELVALAARERVPIKLIGGFDNVAVEAFECLRQKYSGLTTSNQPRMIFVALGAPKQELYIDEQAKKTKGIIYMAVGGSLDIIAGKLPRAPLFARSIGFEWLWRLMLQPWRILRQLALVKFVFLVLREKLRS